MTESAQATSSNTSGASENAAPEVKPDSDDEQGDSLTPAERRAKHDITTERGCRRMILEYWNIVEKLHGPSADGRQVRRILLREKDESEAAPVLKTVQNKLAELRSEKLIP